MLMLCLTLLPLLCLTLLPLLGLPNAILYVTKHEMRCCLLRHACLYSTTKNSKTLPSHRKTRCTSQWGSSDNPVTNYPALASYPNSELVHSMLLSKSANWHIDWICLPTGRYTRLYQLLIWKDMSLILSIARLCLCPKLYTMTTTVHTTNGKLRRLFGLDGRAKEGIRGRNGELDGKDLVLNTTHGNRRKI